MLFTPKPNDGTTGTPWRSAARRNPRRCGAGHAPTRPHEPFHGTKRGVSVERPRSTDTPARTPPPQAVLIQSLHLTRSTDRVGFFSLPLARDPDRTHTGPIDHRPVGRQHQGERASERDSCTP
eukprot:COSAG01_NODE_1809_length_9182_cov_6.406914_7_plen_123_part_00